VAATCSDTSGSHLNNSHSTIDSSALFPTLARTADSASDGVWYEGSTSLAIEGDEDVLSPLHCYMRKYCVEAFSCSNNDISTPRYGKAHNSKIVVGQVGIRCLHCKTMKEQKPERAVCFPSSLKNIYHSIETWQRRHSIVCAAIPKWIRRDLAELVRNSKSTAGGRRQYWEESARKLGMVDTPRGVRFSRPPGLLHGEDEECDDVNVHDPVDPLVVIVDDDEEGSPFSPSNRHRQRKNLKKNSKRGLRRPLGAPKRLVTDDERPLVTDYLFLLMSQMEVCYFTEDDRSGGRSKVKDFPVGFPGMQCTHCNGKAGFGRYFPSSVDALALANSDRNIYNHLKKCRKCPDEIRNELKVQKASKNKRGSRKTFFGRVWKRIHGENARKAY